MNANSKPPERPAVTDASPASRSVHVVVFALFLVGAIARGATLLLAQDNERWVWLDGLVLLLAVLTTLTGHAQRLPLEKVLFAGGVTAFMGGVVMAVGAGTGVPFGAFTYTAKAGGRILGTVPWWLPLIWVVVIFNGRGVARLVFRPWRKTRHYGFLVIGLTGLLAMAFASGFDAFANKINHYWLWQAGQGRLTWYGAPWVNFLGWLLTTLLILAFTTPFLLNKKPQKSPPFYHPLAVWLALNGVFVAGTTAHHLWAAVGVTAAASLGALGFALSGARG